MPTEQLEAHPASLAIPRPRPSELAALADDVSRRGVLEPLRLAGDGRTLDGATRLAVARELGLAAVPTLSAQCEPGEELAYAIRQATLRRHLSDDQRAMLAVRLAAELGGERGRVQRQAAARARWQPDRGC